MNTVGVTLRWGRHCLGLGALLFGCGGQFADGGSGADAGADSAIDGKSSDDAACTTTLPDGMSCGAVLRGPCAEDCFGQAATTTSGEIPCAVVEALEGYDGGESECSAYPGLSSIDAEHSAYLIGARACWALDPSTPVCFLTQLLPDIVVDGSFATCSASSEAGWCYVEAHADAAACATTIAFSVSGEPPPGAVAGVFCGL
ncbi:MAG: hypothetical protein ACRELB_21700 [Polyangiaceae bacterium]